MNEIDLIVKWLQKNSGPVDDVFYYHEYMTQNAAGHWHLGLLGGYAEDRHFFFGNVNILTIIQGVILLTDQMLINHIFATYMTGNIPLGQTNIAIAVNSGVNLLGDGVYTGNKKVYQVGFNRLTTALSDFGAATFVQNITFNGFAFRMK
jgi:hypothetical protein